MVKNIDDLINSFLEDVTGHDINEEDFDRNELYIRWLQNVNNTDSRNITDLQNSLFFLEDSVQFSQYLIKLGFSGSLETMKRAFFSGTISIYPPFNESLNLITSGGVSVFDGDDDYIEVDSMPLDGLGAFSIEAKFNTNDRTVNRRIITSDTSADKFYIRITPTAIAIFTGGLSDTFFSWSDNLSLNTDYIILITYDGSIKRIYIDGDLKASEAATGTTSFGSDFKIGSNRAGSGEFFSGDIDFVKMYDDVTQTNLIADYDLRDNASLGVDNVVDLSGNANHGTSFGKNVFTRTTTGTFTDGNGIIRQASIDQARYEGGGFQITSGNDGEVIGGVSIVEENGILFDGVDGYVQSSLSTNSYTSFSVSAELYVGKTQSGTFRRIVSEEDSNNFSRFSILNGGNDSEYGFNIRASGVNYDHFENGISTGFHHFLLVYDGDNNSSQYYLDNVLVKNNTGLGTVITGITDIRVGRGFGTNNYTGTLRKHNIYNKVLSEEERDLDFAGTLVEDGLTLRYSGEHYEGTRTDPIKILDIKDANFDVTFPSNGILIEEQRTNFLNFSEELDISGPDWTGNNTTVDLNKDIAPDGQLTGDRVIPIVGTQFSGVSKTFNDRIINTVYTFSIFAKKNDFQWIRIASRDTLNAIVDSWFDIENGVVGNVEAGHTSEIKAYDDSWYKVSISLDILGGVVAPQFFALCADGNGFDNVTGDGSKYNTFWGAQLEEGSMPTSYIKTEATAVTRTPDVCSYDATDLIVQGQGSLYAEFIYFGVDSGASNYIIMISNGTDSDRILLLINDDKKIRTFVSLAGATQMDFISPLSYSVNTTHKVLVTYKNSEIKTYIDGELIVTDIVNTIPTNFTTLVIGNNNSGLSQLNGTIKNVKYHKEIIGEKEAINMTRL